MPVPFTATRAEDPDWLRRWRLPAADLHAPHAGPAHSLPRGHPAQEPPGERGACLVVRGAWIIMWMSEKGKLDTKARAFPAQGRPWATRGYSEQEGERGVLSFRDGWMICLDVWEWPVDIEARCSPEQWSWEGCVERKRHQVNGCE